MKYEENHWKGFFKKFNEYGFGWGSVNDVKKAVQGMKNVKDVGPDGISAEVWKILRIWVDINGRFLFSNKLLHE